MRDLFRFWFTSDDPVDRRTYFIHGLALASVKYLVDAALIWVFAGVVWTPVDYLVTGISLERSRLSDAPAFLPILLAAWTAPFFWIGLTLSARRARDAGITPWLAQLFFVPLLNYPFIAIMSVARTSSRAPGPPAPEQPRLEDQRARVKLGAIGLGAAAGIALIAVALWGLESYGASVFFGAPFVIGAITAYALNRPQAARRGETAKTVMWALVATGLAIIAFAVEGLICVLMAFPLAALIALLGAKLGRWIALNDRSAPRHAFLAVLVFPAVTPIVDSRRVPLLHEVKTAIEIEAPPLVVWRHVIAFAPLDPPTELVFRSGIAYPVGARIEGAGVGAVRYCQFSTGAFEEPITHWEPGKRLSFDVTRHPAPMRELSPYDIAPPHLDGYFAARRGEFRLVALPGGRTRVEGSTWYELRIDPQTYWSPMADALVRAIHQRVLRHIKTIAEREFKAR